MVTSFNRKDLVAFGQFLLSPKRREFYSNHPLLGSETLEERLQQVNHSDVENFLHERELKSLPLMSFEKALKCLKIGMFVSLKQNKGDWYLYKFQGQSIRVVNNETGDSEEYFASPQHLKSNDWVAWTK